MKKVILTLLIGLVGLQVNAVRPVATRLDPDEHPIIGSSVKSSAITVNGGTAQALPLTAYPGRMTLTILNNGSTALYLGHAGVTSTNGLILQPADSINFQIGDQAAIYGVSNGSSLNVRAFEG